MRERAAAAGWLEAGAAPAGGHLVAVDDHVALAAVHHVEVVALVALHDHLLACEKKANKKKWLDGIITLGPKLNYAAGSQ